MDDDTRAEAALRRALTREADAFEPVDLTPRTGARRRRWLLPVAAAAASVLVVGGGLVATGVIDVGDDPVTAVAGDGSTRTVWWRNVAVDVPTSWQDGAEPGPAWCAGGGATASGPYVARESGFAAVEAIACPPPSDERPVGFGTAPQDLWQPHVSFVDVAGPGALAEGEQTFDGWTVAVQSVSSEVQVHVWSDAATHDVGRAVLESARTFEVDPNGCDTRSPAQSAEQVRPDPSDVTQVDDVESVAVCQYDRTRGAGVGLMASRLLTDADADALLDAIRTAPEGGGPDDPASCTSDHEGDTAIVTRLLHEGGSTDLFVYYDWCFGNGYDDGTTRRALTEDNCAPLFGGPVRWFSISGVVGTRCG
jgi:hypothetical protein